MSRHYSANQYNEPFLPKRLRNWSYGVNHPGTHPQQRCGYTIPIADNRGHLFPCMKRDPNSSPWGRYRGWIWEEPSTKCDCVDRIRRPDDYTLPPCNIMVARERRFPTTEARATAMAVACQMFQPAPEPELEIVSGDPEQQC